MEGCRGDGPCCSASGAGASASACSSPTGNQSISCSSVLAFSNSRLGAQLWRCAGWFVLRLAQDLWHLTGLMHLGVWITVCSWIRVMILGGKILKSVPLFLLSWGHLVIWLLRLHRIGVSMLSEPRIYYWVTALDYWLRKLGLVQMILREICT
jgi:hypothetical protein